MYLFFSRADTRSVTRSEARSYNETIIRPVTRRLNTPAGTSYRSSRSHATTSEVSKKKILICSVKLHNQDFFFTYQPPKKVNYFLVPWLVKKHAYIGFFRFLFPQCTFSRNTVFSANLRPFLNLLTCCKLRK